jgi:taurine--2-oxoglutarate transaminase
MQDLKSQNLQDAMNHTLFSWSKQTGLNPIEIERAEGVYTYDASGKKYIDFSSQLVNVNIGHGNKKVINAITKQLSKVQFVSPASITEVRAKLGKKIAQLAPGNLNKTFFTLGGSESVENAIKLARIYTGKHKIMSFYRSYHGASFAAMGAGGDPRKFEMEKFGVPHMLHVENPYFYRCPWDTKSLEACGDKAIQNIEKIIEYENPGSIAAIVMEGESGSSGCITYPEDFWKKIREICDKNNILLIDDEIMSGFARTGKMFAAENHGVVPDMMCIAKGLTSGYVPMGGLMVTDEIANSFNDRMLPLGLTYSAHPVSCAAALATLEVYEELNLVNRANEMGEYLKSQLLELQKKHLSIGDVRITGMLGCLELVKNRETKEHLTPWNAPEDKMEPTHRIIARLRELGLTTLIRWNCIFVAPPLVITKEQIDEGVDILSKALRIADEYYIK